MELRQFEFARRDYEGLSKEAAEKLKQLRADYADDLRSIRDFERSNTREDLRSILRSGRQLENVYLIKSGDIVAGHDVKTRRYARGKSNAQLDRIIDNYKKKILDQQISNANDAGPKLRKRAIEEATKNKDSIAQNTTKKASKGLLNFVKNHKKAIGGTALGATVLGTGGYYLYKRNKNNNK